jgi:hypothetical protein
MGLPPTVIHAHTTPNGLSPAYLNLQASAVTGAEEEFVLIVRSAPADGGHTARIHLTREELACLAGSVNEHLSGAPCPLPPPGWHCTRAAGHDGPCAALPTGSEGGEHV